MKIIELPHQQQPYLCSSCHNGMTMFEGTMSCPEIAEDERVAVAASILTATDFHERYCYCYEIKANRLKNKQQGY